MTDREIIVLHSTNPRAFQNGEFSTVSLFSDEYQETTEERYVKRVTRTLVEDDQLYSDLVDFASNRYTLNGDPLTLSAVKECMDSRCTILGIHKIDGSTDSGYTEDYHDGSRWEGDCNPDGARYSPRCYNMIGVLTDFVKTNPDKARFTVKEEWVKED